jgi:multimeric flavodoxin WrbA
LRFFNFAFSEVYPLLAANLYFFLLIYSSTDLPFYCFVLPADGDIIIHNQKGLKGKFMAAKVLGISASPRKDGNSEILLKKALEGAESAGLTSEFVRLADLDIAPCIECNHCYETGVCKIQDDFQIIMKKMLNSQRLIFATPIFFLTVSAQAKLLIDRCQCLWARKIVLKRPLGAAPSPTGRGAMVIAVGGSKSKKMFESIRLTMKSYFCVIDTPYAAGLFVNKIDHPGDIEKHPQALEQAFQLGWEFALKDFNKTTVPEEVEIT